jgi:CubicO group peptidase (beta-lactamase class C family)
MSTQKVTPTIKKPMAIVLTLALLLSVIAPAMAQEDKAASDRNLSAAPLQEQGPTDPAEMEAFLDDVFAKEMNEYHIAGAAIAVVKDGKLFFAKGYGYADLEDKIPVDPELALFKIGSGTKVFTWTAVMQLVEQEKLDLDADVNNYLDFRIPDTYPQPITLKHLMSHTAGFEDQHVDLVAWNEKDLAPERDWLVSHIPARVHAPGEIPAYSNYGAALAGYIVARVSGESYSQYIEEHILDPLGMKSSTASWPTPSDLRARESVGYMYEDDAFKVFPPIYGQVDLFPAGIIRTTVTDMARFMIAHLQDGFYGDAAAEVRILEEDTARQMHSTLYAPDPRFLGNAYGFFEFSDNGQRVIGHSGEAEPMHSLLLLLPGQNVGIFVVYNSSDAGSLVTQHSGFQRSFFDHYYPAPALEPIQPPADFAEWADRFVGAYRWTRSSSTTLEKYTTQLFSPLVEVKNPGDGTLFMTTPYGDMRLVEVEPLYFQQADGPFHIVFREDAQGRIAYMFTDMIPQFAFEKEKWYETPGFNMPLLMVSLFMFLSVLPVTWIRVIRSRRAKGSNTSMPRGARVAHQLIIWISVLNLLFVAGTVVWGPWVMFGIPLIYKIVMGLGVLASLLTVGALVYTVLAWKNSYWGIAARVYYTLVTVAAVAFVWFLNQWNLLGWRY